MMLQSSLQQIMFQVDQQNISQSTEQPLKQPIRSYIRIFPASGIDPINSEQYEILDGNTLLNKKNPTNLIMHPFNYVFNAEFDSVKMIQHMNLINDAFDGNNQFVISEIQKNNMMGFILGTVQQPGFIVQLGTELFYEAHYHHLKTEKNLTSRNINTKQKLGLSIFSTEDSSNKFLDLILGQKLTYYSKKDMDQYKNFYTKQITNIREFLILLKISLVHYRQRCREGDPIVFKFSINSYDEIHNKNYSSSLEVAIIQRNSKLINAINKKIQFSLGDIQAKGEDHGSLANYIERGLKRNKLIYLYGIPYRNHIMIQSIPKFNFMSQLRENNTLVSKNHIEISPRALLQKLSGYTILKYNVSISNLNPKEMNFIISLLAKMVDFVNESGIKWKNYCYTLMEILNTQEQFYEKQRFPVGLEIKDDNFKNFMISKVYKLSETFQIQDLTTQLQKLRTIKNQITISLKALLSAPKKTSSNNNTSPSVNISSKQSSLKTVRSKLLTKFLQQFYYKTLEQYKVNLKIMFSFNYHITKFHNLQLTDIQQMFQTKNMKDMINKLKQQQNGNNGNTDRDDKIMLRKIKFEEEVEEDLDISKSMHCSAIIQRLDESMSNKYNIKLSKLNKNCYHQKIYSQNIKQTGSLQNSNINHENLNYLSNLNNYPTSINNQSLITKQIIFQNNKSAFLNLSCKNKENSYNFSLPRIAVIHHRKKRLL